MTFPTRFTSSLTDRRKTELAVEYAHSFHARHPDVAVLWLYAGSAERFNESVREIAQALGPSALNAASNGGDLESFFRHLADYRKGKWLMIIDGADTDLRIDGRYGERGSLFRLVPQTTGCRVLVTTRDRKVGMDLVGRWSKPIPVDPMGWQDCARLLAAHTSPELLVGGSIQDLISNLAFLPLVLS